jgi:hypothetical protein
MSGLRRGSFIGICLAVVLAAGCGSGSETHSSPRSSAAHAKHRQRQREERRRERRARARARARRLATQRAARRRQLAALGCPAPDRVLAGVYHPDRLLVRDPCRKISGSVEDVRDEEDGDIHVLVALDPPYRAMLMPNNRSEQNGDLVVEFIAPRLRPSAAYQHR